MLCKSVQSSGRSVLLGAVVGGRNCHPASLLSCSIQQALSELVTGTPVSSNSAVPCRPPQASFTTVETLADAASSQPAPCMQRQYSSVPQGGRSFSAWDAPRGFCVSVTAPSTSQAAQIPARGFATGHTAGRPRPSMPWLHRGYASDLGPSAEAYDVFQLEEGKTHVDGYGPDGFIVNGIEVMGSVFCLEDVFTLWRVREWAELSVESLALLALYKPAPELLVIGCGTRVQHLSKGEEHILCFMSLALVSRPIPYISCFTTMTTSLLAELWSP